MKILVINAGSSSLKYQLMNMTTNEIMAVGVCERIGIDGGIITHKTLDGTKITENLELPTHKEALARVTALLTEGKSAVIANLSEIDAVGHRAVHGGETYSKSTLINEDVIKHLENLTYLAPLHHPAQISVIKICQEILGSNVKHVAVFDTAFHQTMSPAAYTYSTPYEYYEKYGVRRYGAHGTSHMYVADRCSVLMNKDIKDLKIITCHLGNGCSITAVDGGKSVDTSMGLGPMGGIVMGTRCGDIDPTVLTVLGEKENLSASEISAVINKQSGLLGISGVSSDARDIENAAADGNERAQLALDVQLFGIKKYIGSYAAVMGGVDAIVFTGGIGENSKYHREHILENMEFFGVKIDKERNNTRGGEVLISTDDSTTKAFIIQTNEELVIATDTLNLTK